MSERVRQVPLIRPDLPPFDDIADDLREAIASGQLTNFGPHVCAFEEECSRYLGAEAVSMSSGTAGLLLLLQAADLQRGAAVALPSFTFVATAQAVVQAGGVPVFVDVGEDGNIDPDDLEELLQSRDDVEAVIGVHLYGLPCDTARVEAAVVSYGERVSRNVAVVYDAAHAFGASRGGVRVGTAGLAEVFSLSVTKALVSVEGGMVTTTNSDLADRLRRMRNYGIHSDYNATEPGLNSKMSELHAIVGRRNLGRLDDLIQRRQVVARDYRVKIEEETTCSNIQLRDDVVHTFKDLTVLLPQELSGKRDRIRRFMADRGVETRAYFDPPVHQQTFFAQFADRPLPVTDEVAARVLSLPFFTTMSGDDVDQVVSVLAAAERGVR